ncbi:MAG TPA: hypothetical protein VK138_16325 [Acidiferrobacterales bacterium]|nr:hypothetical protein [Acidiferrobacterales bacterium]
MMRSFDRLDSRWSLPSTRSGAGMTISSTSALLRWWERVCFTPVFPRRRVHSTAVIPAEAGIQNE